MSASDDFPCFSLAIERLPLNEALPANSANHFAVHVTQAPYWGGYVLGNRLWAGEVAQVWRNWQELFSARGVPDVPHVSQVNVPVFSFASSSSPEPIVPTDQPISRSARLMQTLGITLWHWLFDGAIQASLDRSRGIATGQGKALRLRLDIRDPDLIALPWEIMQSDAGKQAVSLGQQILFSRTTSDVDALPPLRTEQTLNVLLVLGQDAAPAPPSGQETPQKAQNMRLKLEQEATALARILTPTNASGFNRFSSPSGSGRYTASCHVDTLLQPTPEELTRCLETRNYNVLFYSGHGIPAADGGLLFLRPEMPMNGTELAQLLTRCRVKLAVFNACWGAQPDHQGQSTIPHSSLAEVLLYHGVPAVLAMRDSIADEEALRFIEAFAQALAERRPIDEAVAVARQHLLTLFRFNHQAWTLPVLYMHPGFDGELVKPLEEGMTQIPTNPSHVGIADPVACLRSPEDAKEWWIRGGLMRVGISPDNDLVLVGEPGVSRKHAEIFYRNLPHDLSQPNYFLRDFSRYGTWVLLANQWQKIHHQEVLLPSGAQLKFGGSRNLVLEFLVKYPDLDEEKP